MYLSTNLHFCSCKLKTQKTIIVVIRKKLVCLETPIEWPRNCHTFAWQTRITQSFFQFFQGTFLLLQLLDQRVHCIFGPLFFLVALFPAQQPLDGRTREWKQTVQAAYWRWHCSQHLSTKQKALIMKQLLAQSKLLLHHCKCKHKSED